MLWVAFIPTALFAQATILPPGETCFSATAGISGMLGLLGTITGGAGGISGTYGGIALTGGSGSNATANVTVSGGTVTALTVLNPGIGYVVGDVLSAVSSTIGNVSGFSVPVASTSINSSLAGGSVAFYIPNTQTPKQTWQDAGELTLNQNPVPLDQNGCAVIYGAGTYLMVVQDSLGNTVYSKLTAATNGANGIFWAALAGGTGNAITVVDTNFANQDGYNIQFLAKTANTGPATITVSGGSPIAIVNDTSTGPAALSGGEIGPFNTPMLTYDATNVQFHIVNPASTSSSSASSSLVPPQGYLNLVGQATGDVVQTGDVTGAATVYYSPFVGANLPIWNGSTFVQTAFSELTATLTSSGSASNAIQDACIFSNNGVPTLAIGPAWTTPTAGAGNRGTGAGTAQITRLQGIWVNAVQITGYNGLSSFTIGANRCTYVGSLSIDGTAGQVSAYVTYGQSRKFGVWNAYNRQQITLQAGDATSSWSYNGSTLRPANNNSANSITVFAGLPEEGFSLDLSTNVSYVSVSGGTTAFAVNGVGYNSTTVQSGYQSFSEQNPPSGTVSMAFLLSSKYQAPPAVGVNVVTALEANGSGISVAPTWLGTAKNLLLTAKYRG